MSRDADNRAAAGQGQDTIKARPTLIIGLGGTGGDVLLRIRKRFFEKYGSLDEFPIVSYLWLDTDSKEQHVIAKEFTEFVSFRDPEKLMTTIYRTADIIEKLDNPDNRHIKDWWYPGLNSVPSLVEGAGQVRAYSRLGFVHYLDKAPDGIRDRLQRQMDIISGAAPRARMLKSEAIKQAGGADLDDSGRVNVYVICSLAGGTGSGMFLDLAFLVKKLNPAAELCGYLVLPRFFGSQPKMDANGYAALKELNYFSSNGMDVQWNMHGYPGERLPSPPFDFCYLLDSRNMAGHAVGGTSESREAILEMMADSIFKDFTHGAFANKKRSCRVNIRPHTDSLLSVGVGVQDLQFRQTFPLRFYSMGMASIVMPHDRITTACSYRLAGEIVDYWGGLKLDDVNISTLTEKVREQILPLTSIGLSQDVVKGQQRNDMMEFLGREASGQGQLSPKIEFWARECANEVKRGLPAQNRKSRRAYLEERIEQQKTLFADDSKSQARWGDYARTIFENGEKLKEQAVAGLRKEIARLINEEQYGIGYAVALLEHVVQVLKDPAYRYRRRFEQEMQDAEARMPKAQRAYLGALDSLAQHEQRRNWDGRNTIILDYELDSLQRAIAGTARDPGFFRLVLTRCIARTAVGVCDYVIEFLEGKPQGDGSYQAGYVDNLKQLKGGLADFHARLQRRMGHFRDNRRADLSLVLYDPSKFDEIYNRYVEGSPEGRKKFVSAKSADVLKLLGGDVTRLTALAGDQAQALENTILAQVRGVFDPIRVHYHVVTEFERSFKREDRVRHLKLMAAKARPLIQGRDPNPARFEFRAETQERAVGIPVTPQGLKGEPAAAVERARDELKYILQHELGMDPRQFEDIPDTSEIIFYNEVGAFPINYIDEVKNYRDKYEILRPTERLHITSDDRKFEDLMVMETERLRAWVDAAECFALGRIFGVLTPVRDGDQMHYHWMETKGINEFRRDLGDRQGTLHELVRNSAVRKDLLARSYQFLDRVKVSAENLVRYYAVLNREYGATVKAGDGHDLHEDQLPFEKMVMAKVLAVKLVEAENASQSWTTKEDFKAQAREKAKVFGEFTTPLGDQSFLLKLEKSTGL